MDFKLKKEGKIFSIFNFVDYKPSWIYSKEKLSYELIKFEAQELEMNINSINQEIEIKVAYHPYWKAKINNKEIKIFETKNGLIGMNIPEGYSNINLKFIAIPKIFNLISLVSLLLISLILLHKNNKT